MTQSWDQYHFNIDAASVTRQPLSPSAGTLISSVPGVARVQPLIDNSINLRGQDGSVWAVPDKPLYGFHLVSGRLLTPADTRTRARVVVVEQAIARASSTHVGQQVLLFTFPPLNIPIALIATLVLALLVIQMPLRRAVRFKPGEAFRYA